MTALQRTTRGIVAGAIVTCLAAQAAQADGSKAWAAAKDSIPASAQLVAGFDAAAIVKTKAFEKMFATLVKAEKDIEQGLAFAKLACKVDPLAVIDGVVLAVNAQIDDDDGVAFVQLKGMDRAAVEACAVALLKAAGEKNPVAKQEGAITAIGAGNDVAYMQWVKPDVVAISFEPEKKAHLTGWTSGGGAFGKSALATQVAKLDPKSVAWVAAGFPKPLDDNDLPLVKGHGQATVTGGKVALKFRGTFADAKVAASTHAKMKKDLMKELADKDLPAVLKKVGRAMKIGLAGADITLDVTATEADAASVFEAVVR